MIMPEHSMISFSEKVQARLLIQWHGYEYPCLSDYKIRITVRGSLSPLQHLIEFGCDCFLFLTFRTFFAPLTA